MSDVKLNPLFEVLARHHHRHGRIDRRTGSSAATPSITPSKVSPSRP